MPGISAGVKTACYNYEVRPSTRRLRAVPCRARGLFRPCQRLDDALVLARLDDTSTKRVGLPVAASRGVAADPSSQRPGGRAGGPAGRH